MRRCLVAQGQELDVVAVTGIKVILGPLTQFVSSTETGHFFFRRGLCFEPYKGTRSMVFGKRPTRLFDFRLDGVQKLSLETFGVKVKPCFILVWISFGYSNSDCAGASGVVGHTEAGDANPCFSFWHLGARKCIGSCAK